MSRSGGGGQYKIGFVKGTVYSLSAMNAPLKAGACFRLPQKEPTGTGNCYFGYLLAPCIYLLIRAGYIPLQDEIFRIKETFVVRIFRNKAKNE